MLRLDSLKTSISSLFVTLSFLSVSEYLCCSQACSFLMFSIVSDLFRFFSRLSGVVPSAPTNVGIILVFTFHSFLSSRARFWYLPILSCSFSSTLVSPGTAISINTAISLPAALRAAQATGILFTQRPILRFFAPQGDTLHRWGESRHGEGNANFHHHRCKDKV